jgi:hypothetical protein
VLPPPIVDASASPVDPQTPEYNPRPLVAYMEAEGIPYFYLSQVWCFTRFVLEYSAALS